MVELRHLRNFYGAYSLMVSTFPGECDGGEYKFFPPVDQADSRWFLSTVHTLERRQDTTRTRGTRWREDHSHLRLPRALQSGYPGAGYLPHGRLGDDVERELEVDPEPCQDTDPDVSEALCSRDLQDSRRSVLAGDRQPRGECLLRLHVAGERGGEQDDAGLHLPIRLYEEGGHRRSGAAEGELEDVESPWSPAPSRWRR